MAWWNHCGFSFHDGNTRKMVQGTALQVHLAACPNCPMGSHGTAVSLQERHTNNTQITPSYLKS